MSHGFRYNNTWVMPNPDQKLGVSFWDYLGARLPIRKAPAVPPLPDLIRARCATGFTHEGLRSCGRGQFPRDYGFWTLLRPAKRGTSEPRAGLS